MHFSSHTLSELEGLKFNQRMQVIRKAAEHISTPKKLVLNLVKLAILVPFFLVIARYDSATDLLSLLGLAIAYPLVTRPLTFKFCQPYLQQSRDSFKFDVASKSSP